MGTSPKLAFVFMLMACGLQAQTKKNQLVGVYERKTENGLEIFGSNRDLVPYTVEIFVECKNLQSDKKFPLTTVLPAGSAEVLVATLTPVKKNKGWRYGSKFIFYMGDYRAEHNDDFVYALPFAPGKRLMMAQGYNGAFSHEGKNAIDFNMPIGTAVHAARGGLVLKVKDDSNKGCPYRRCLEQANKITIYHEDGSFADYAHLKKNGSLVKAGDTVAKGQPIGYSGNTGFSSGPHLHFEVYQLRKNRYLSIPTDFWVAPGVKEKLKEREYYTAF